jgi:predicted nucleic acid-binding protein
MNVVDSSAWLEYFGNGPNAAAFAAAIEDRPNLLVPSIVLLEVFRHVSPERGRRSAYFALGRLRQGMLVPLDEPIAIEAARIGLREGLALADSVILATTRAQRATLWTQDAHFAAMEGVWYFAKQQTANGG